MQLKSQTEIVERAKAEILADIAAGFLPANVRSFRVLHGFLDANYYGGAFEAFEAAGDDTDSLVECMEMFEAVQRELNQWLRAGRPG